jgi:hypothetical protein
VSLALTDPPVLAFKPAAKVTRETNSSNTSEVKAKVSQESDAESENENGEAEYGTFYNESEEEEEMEEEDDPVQIVTPRSKTTVRQRSKTTGMPKDTEVCDADTPLTIAQYQSVIADYKERLLRAERQVRAISKTSLADRFMENEVHKFVKESLWKRCKFITCTETMSDCMNEVAGQFAIPGNKREHWKNTYAHAVRNALNNRHRNNTSQDLKREFSGK